jgi:parallel beta-helix repeat protein
LLLRLFLTLILLTTACQESAVSTVTSAPPPAESLASPPAAASPTAVAPSPPGADQPSPTADAGTTYYVSPDGDDNDGGSASAPWRTLQHAADHVAPGDTILVLSGTYQGLRIERSGTPQAWITLKAAPDAQVVVNAPGPNNQHDSNVEVETWEGEGVVAYWVIEGLEVSNAPNWGVDLRGNDSAKSHHITIRGNRVHHNGLDGGKTGIFAAFVDDLLVEDNESYANGEHGIYVNNSSDRFTIRGNQLYDNAACGLHLNGDVEQGGDGVLSDGLIENNVMHGNGVEGGAAINMDGVTDTIVRNNLIYGNYATGIALFQENGALCSQRDRVSNNTVLVPADGRWALSLGATDCTDNQIFNNILYSDHGYRGSINLPAPQVAGFQSDYNVVVDRFTTDDSESVISLAEWQALGYDAHSIIATPDELFVDPAGHDYHLQAGSPAIDAGTARSEAGTDLEGTPRPAGAAFDIGCYEYTGAAPPPSPVGNGVITYRLDDQLYRIPAREGAVPENVSAALDDLSPRAYDEWLNVSPDGAWLLVNTERFDPECDGWACLALVAGDLSSAEVLRSVDGQLVRSEGFGAVASGGNLVVYSNDGSHEEDLWAVTRSGASWSAPLLLTGDSPYAYNHHPAISPDGSKVVFDCGDVPYGQEGTAICEVGTDGADLSVVLTPAQVPGGSAQNGLHHPDYAPDGGIVFEADVEDSEQIWRLAPGATQPVRISDEFNNDNSPCVLPDGRIASLWLGRPGGGGHEIKVMSADGSSHVMALPGQDVADIGIGCGASAQVTVFLPLTLTASRPLRGVSAGQSDFLPLAASPPHHRPR